MPPGSYYDPAVAGDQIAMPPPLVDDAVRYADGTKATVPQMAHDVSSFLDWASHPHARPSGAASASAWCATWSCSRGWLFFSSAGCGPMSGAK